MRGRWWTPGWWLASIIALAATCCVALLSGSFTWGHYFDNRHLLALGNGELELWTLVDAGWNEGGLQDVFADYYFPRPWPADGLMRSRAFDLAWRWPALHMEAHRGVGVWWEFRLPLWTMAVGIMAVSAALRLRAAWPRRHPASPPRWSTAGRVTLGLSLATSALILATWMVNRSWYFGGTNGLHAIEIERSALVFCTTEDLAGEPDGDPDAAWTWHQGPQQPQWHWELPHTEESTMACMQIWHELVLPLWMLSLVAAAPATLLLWHHRPRPRPGHCRQCDYDLTGNVSGRCPECGEGITTETRRHGEKR